MPISSVAILAGSPARSTNSPPIRRTTSARSVIGTTFHARYALLDHMVDAGLLGKKTGQGFHAYGAAT
jgi:hypothetical protein